jgi:hypothetical protein
MSAKNTNGHITYKQYRLADLFIFMLIMVVCEIINLLAIKKWFPDMLFSISLMFTVSLIVLVRWNFLSAVFPIVDAVIFCWLNGAGTASYVIYIVGNLFILLTWFIFKLIPKEKLFSKWYLTLIYPIAAFILVCLGRAAVAACFGESFGETLVITLGNESLNIVFAILALLVLRKFDGMLEDQKHYLLRVAKEKEEVKAPEQYWDGYSELDDDELETLSGKKHKSISLEDEYPPDSR